mmetsp:Transcript_29652/g.71242  ORF Transcript_29652/g.71242 Transcript_29652/m.71242 type:complete len:219 (+) Transcript_29652:221-877(+)
MASGISHKHGPILAARATIGRPDHSILRVGVVAVHLCDGTTGFGNTEDTGRLVDEEHVLTRLAYTPGRIRICSDLPKRKRTVRLVLSPRSKQAPHQSARASVWGIPHLIAPDDEERIGRNAAGILDSLEHSAVVQWLPRRGLVGLNVSRSHAQNPVGGQVAVIQVPRGVRGHPPWLADVTHRWLGGRINQHRSLGWVQGDLKLPDHLVPLVSNEQQTA